MSDSGFIRGLCMGRIEEDQLIPFRSMAETERETVAAVAESIDDLLGSRGEDFRAWDRAGELPPGFLDELKEFGLFSLIIPEEDGGLGFGATAYSRTLQQLSRHDASVAVTIGAHSSIGMRGLLLFGTDEQKARYLPSLATGEMIAAFCLTEPGAGSDAASLRTTAERDGEGWVLNGSKLWITNGGIAQFFTVFAKTGLADERRGMSAFIVRSDQEGVSVGPHEDKMGLRASSTTSVFFDNVRLEPDALLGEEHKGFKIAMKILNSGRTGLGGGCVGAMKKLIEQATRQAGEREQFGRPIGGFQLTQKKLAEMAVEITKAQMLAWRLGRLKDSGKMTPIQVSVGKLNNVGIAVDCARVSREIHGAMGITDEYPIMRHMMNLESVKTYEGTNDIHTLAIGRHLTGLSAFE